MTTKVTILNHGPNTIRVSGGTSGSPTDIAPHQHDEVYLYDAAPLAIDELADQPTPNLAGGHGEEG